HRAIFTHIEIQGGTVHCTLDHIIWPGAGGGYTNRRGFDDHSGRLRRHTGRGRYSDRSRNRLWAVPGKIRSSREDCRRYFKCNGHQEITCGLAMTGTLVSIPVFFDAAFVILNKVIKSLATKTGIAKI